MARATKGAARKAAPTSSLKLTDAQLLELMKRHTALWTAHWRKSEPTVYAKQRRLMQEQGDKYQLPMTGRYLFLVCAYQLIAEMFAAEGIEPTDADTETAFDQFDAAIRDPNIVDQLKGA